MRRFDLGTFVQRGFLASLALASISHQEPVPRRSHDGSVGKEAGELPNFSPMSTAQLFGKRADEPPGEGALLCPDGICVDESCCSKNGVCGYGEDFCGDGCQSNCEATAMCGELSKDGDIPCGLNLCCSSGGWCGTTEVHCVGPNKWALCQPGYGSCKVITPKTCGEDSGTADGRMIGYYQASNVRDRGCNKVAPKDIKTDKYTHLYWAFASIDPAAYTIKLWDAADEEHVRDFTGLKGKGRDLQTWVAVGGFDFSDPGDTHHTWSELCADAGHRKAFIDSAAAFMDKYGFQGIDLDWEYPGEERRGGSRRDVANFVLLLKEMRAAYGSKYGISLTLAPDYWYLRYFDVQALDPYVDHFGFMAYDLHGSWDADVKALQPTVRGQADIREIYNNTVPLAYAGVDFAKIDFGVAWYGRGYTVSDAGCNTLGCPFSGPSKPARCTGFPGVMSLSEVDEKIKAGATSRLLESSAMKELVWDDQWIGYDDEETIELKRKFANNYCFGGMMAWSVDFEPGTGGGGGGGGGGGDDDDDGKDKFPPPNPGGIFVPTRGQVDLGDNSETDSSDWPEELKEEICEYSFDSDSADETFKSWVGSGAAYWFMNWIKDVGADDWSNKFFKQVIAGGHQGGSTYDCKSLHGGNCPGPLDNPCTGYNPPMAFYMHLQIGNMHAAYKTLWAKTVENGVSQLSSGIKKIVAKYGTPPESDNSMILNMLVGILTSAAGIGAAVAPVAGPLTFFAGMFAQMSADSASWDQTVPPDVLNDKLEEAFGDMFNATMSSVYGYVEDIFDGKLPPGWSEDDIAPEDWIFSLFGMGDWMNKELVNPMVEAYIEGSQKKWTEFAVTRALKSGNNKFTYSLMASDEDTECTISKGGVGSFPSSVDMSEKVCKDKMEGCIWHDNRCLCFGKTATGAGSLSTIAHNLVGDDLKDLKGHLVDYEAALKNNYDCVKWRIENPGKCNVGLGTGRPPAQCTIEDPGVPSRKDLDLKNPLKYTKCWFNFPPAMGHNYGCGWKQ